MEAIPGKIKIPTLLMVEHNGIFGDKVFYADRIANNLHSSTGIVIKDAGHFPLIEQPQRFYQNVPMTARSDFQPSDRTPEDFERLIFQLETKNNGWYQAKFRQLGYKLYPKFKIDIMRKFIDSYSTNGKRIAPLNLLNQLAPEIPNQWVEEMKQLPLTSKASPVLQRLGNEAGVVR